MARLQMGAFSLGANGVFLSNHPSDSYSFQQFSIPLKPIIRITLNPVKVRKTWFLDARTVKPRFTNALASGTGSLEKGFQFSPNFDDYVKVMESIRTERSKNSSSDIDGGLSLKKRSLGKDASDAQDSKGKDKLIRSNKSVFREKADDHRGRRRRNSEDARGVTKSREHDSVESSASGWGLVEGILEKASTGSSDQSDGDFKDGRNSSYRKFEGAGENVDPAHFKKKDARFGNYSKNQKDMEQNGRDVQRVSGLEIPKERKDALGYGSDVKLGAMSWVGRDSRPRGQKIRYDDISEEFNKRQVEQKGKWTNERVNSLTRDKYTSNSKMERRSYDNLGDTTRVGSDYRPRGQKFSYDDNSKEFSERQVEQKGKWAHDRINSSTRDKYTYRRNMEKGMSDYENSKNLQDREKFEKPTSPFESDRLNETSSSKESNGSNIHNNKWKNETCVTVVQRKTEGEWRRSEMKILRMDAEHSKHENYTKQHRAESAIHTTKRDFNTSEKEILEQTDSRTRLRLYDDATETGDLTSGSIMIRGRSHTNASNSRKFAGRDIDAIDHEDRAAFRTFEVFTDVRNRPRILRMEMEERVEKLAKWLNATDINMPEWQFSKMMHSANIKFTDHTILRVVQILGALGNWRRVLQVVEWLHSRERYKSYKSRYIYTTVLNVLGKARRPIEALNIFYTMRKELSSYPDLAAYHCITVILGQAGLLNELFDVIDCMRAIPDKKFKLGPLQKWDPRLEPDLVIYNAVLNACVQQKQWEGAFWVLQQLKLFGIKPTNTTYGLAMEVMLACGRYNLVHEFFRKVNKTSIPSALNYKVLINTLWREGKVDEAVQAVQDMESRGIVGLASIYYDLARCLCSAGRCKEALMQVDKICKVAKKPLVVTYTGLIQACLDSGSIENGAYIFSQMHKFCSPNNITCNIMLKSYLEHGMFEEAKKLFHEILDGSHNFDSRSALRHKVIPDKFMFNTMMEACAVANYWDDFENVYGQMIYHGFYFDTKRHLRMVLDAFRAGKVQVMETTWEHLVCSGRVPPPPIIKERFCLKLEEDNPLAAISCIGVHQEIEMQAFTANAWLSLISSSADRLKKNTIIRLASEVSNLVEESNRPHPIYQNLLNACQEFLSFERNLVDVDHRTLPYDLQLKS